MMKTIFFSFGLWIPVINNPELLAFVLLALRQLATEDGANACVTSDEASQRDQKHHGD